MGVEIWIRLLADDLVVKWQAGIYQPDFYVLATDGRHFVVEVKADKDLTSDTVQAKKRAAVEWVQTVEDAGYASWKYLLLSETAVDRCRTFEQLRRQSL